MNWGKGESFSGMPKRPWYSVGLTRFRIAAIPAIFASKCPLFDKI
jgi:hypothetical protein